MSITASTAASSRAGMRIIKTPTQQNVEGLIRVFQKGHCRESNLTRALDTLRKKPYSARLIHHLYLAASRLKKEHTTKQRKDLYDSAMTWLHQANRELFPLAKQLQQLECSQQTIQNESELAKNKASQLHILKQIESKVETLMKTEFHIKRATRKYHLGQLAETSFGNKNSEFVEFMKAANEIKQNDPLTQFLLDQLNTIFNNKIPKSLAHTLRQIYSSLLRMKKYAEKFKEPLGLNWTRLNSEQLITDFLNIGKGYYDAKTETAKKSIRLQLGRMICLPESFGTVAIRRPRLKN